MKVYFVTGEPSGDLLASSLMRELKNRCPDVEFFGIGGETMKEYGLNSLFDMKELSVMGFFEVLPRLPLILKRVSQTVDDILLKSPDVIVTVDSWGFVKELLGRLAKRNSSIPKVHYVAPQVWAWKRGRAKAVARLTDRLLTLLPYEPQYFEKYGLRCDFVGHPVVENDMTAIDAAAFRSRHNIPPTADLLTVLPGSRHGEVKRLAPVFKKALDMIAAQIDGRLQAVIPTVEAVESEVRKTFADSDVPCIFVKGRAERYAAFRASRAAIAASGTVSLELASCGTPHIVAYKFNPLTDFLADLLVKVEYGNLINLLCDKEVIPEFMLSDCRPKRIAAKIMEIIDDEALAANMRKKAEAGLALLRLPDMLPSERAAEIIMSYG
jgi:lipid-A-disaccharide synthase